MGSARPPSPILSSNSVVVVNCPTDIAVTIAGCALAECEPQWAYSQIKEMLEKVITVRKSVSPGALPTSPSEKKFVSNFLRLVRSERCPTLLNRSIIMEEIGLSHIPDMGFGDKLQVFLMIFQKNDVVCNSLITDRGAKTVSKNDTHVSFKLKQPICGAFLLRFYYRPPEKGPEKFLELHLETGSASPLTV